MEPIPVPAPPKSSFNKNRRVSDLLLSQVKHFQHVAQKLGLEADPALERDIYTGGGAARYITTITRALRSGSYPSKARSVVAIRRAIRPPRQQPATLDLAAGAATPPPKSASRASKAPRRSRKAKPGKKP
jgi:hypothetical protein